MNDNIERNLELQDQYFTGLNDGIQQGIKQTNRAIVINMYKKHFSIKEISEYTNSTIGEVKEIIDNYNK